MFRRLVGLALFLSWAKVVDCDIDIKWWGTGWSSPTALSVDQQNNIYVADSNLVNIINTNTLTGEKRSLGDLTTPSTTFLAPNAVASNGAGTQIYVVDYSQQVYLINVAAGTSEKIYSAGIQINGIAVDPKGNIYISDSVQGVRRIDGVTRAVTSAGDLATPAVTYQYPSAVAVDPFCNLLTTEWVSQNSPGSVRLLNVTSGVVQTLGLSAATPFSTNINGAAIDAFGNVFLSDQGNNRIARIDAKTGAVTSVATAAVPAISNPSDVAITVEGYLFWVDGTVNPVRVLVPPSKPPSPAPTSKPTRKPSGQPTGQPTGRPSHTPSRRPTCMPSGQPTARPTGTAAPTAIPTTRPSPRPTLAPTPQPTPQPSPAPPTPQPSPAPSAAAQQLKMSFKLTGLSLAQVTKNVTASIKTSLAASLGLRDASLILSLDVTESTAAWSRASARGLRGQRERELSSGVQIAAVVNVPTAADVATVAAATSSLGTTFAESIKSSTNISISVSDFATVDITPTLQPTPSPSPSPTRAPQPSLADALVLGMPVNTIVIIVVCGGGGLLLLAAAVWCYLRHMASNHKEATRLDLRSPRQSQPDKQPHKPASKPGKAGNPKPGRGAAGDGDGARRAMRGTASRPPSPARKEDRLQTPGSRPKKVITVNASGSRPSPEAAAGRAKEDFDWSHLEGSAGRDRNFQFVAERSASAPAGAGRAAGGGGTAAAARTPAAGSAPAPVPVPVKKISIMGLFGLSGGHPPSSAAGGRGQGRAGRGGRGGSGVAGGGSAGRGPSPPARPQAARSPGAEGRSRPRRV